MRIIITGSRIWTDALAVRGAILRWEEPWRRAHGSRHGAVWLGRLLEHVRR